MNKREMDELLSKEILTVYEVEQILRLSSQTIIQKIKKGEIEAFSTSPRSGDKQTWRIWSRSVKKIMGIENDEVVPA